MPEFSSLLRQRLGAVPVPKVHPDADTLTAFAEELLPAAERRQVFQHIAECTDCRAVIALILPEHAVAEEAQSAETPIAAASFMPARRRWFQLPSFGLAASLATMVAGIVLLLELPSTKHFSGPQPQPSVARQQEEAKVVPPPAPTTEPSSNAAAQNEAVPGAAAVARGFTAPGHEQITGPAARIATAPTNPQPAASANAAVLDGNVAANQSVPVSGTTRKDYVNNQVFATQAKLVSPAPAPVAELPPAPVAPKPAFVLGQQAMFSTMQKSAPLDSAAVPQGTTVIYPLSSANHQGFFISKVTVVGRELHLKRIIPAIPSESVSGYAMFNPELAQSASSEMAARAPEKAEGDLSQSQAFTTRAMSRSGLTALNQPSTLLWKIAQGKLLKSADLTHWIDGYTGPDSIDFAIVTASGPDIWAGGNNAALIHSRDGGATWERITLGSAATGTITSINANRLHIQVLSSSGQSWSSHDGGKSWVMDN